MCVQHAVRNCRNSDVVVVVVAFCIFINLAAMTKIHAHINTARHFYSNRLSIDLLVDQFDRIESNEIAMKYSIVSKKKVFYTFCDAFFTCFK